MKSDTQAVLESASNIIMRLKGHILDVVDIKPPPDIQYAQNLLRVISKLSPLVGNLIEFSIVSLLNEAESWLNKGRWIRQDPGFPDTLFLGGITPNPGIEIKTWFPLATEMTARFKDSITHFEHDQTYVAVIAWLPEHLIYGRPTVIDIWIGSARSLCIARDQHYHSPPGYLVIEPEDTRDRTINLQQTTTSGYKFQEDSTRFLEAVKEVLSWESSTYSILPEYQNKLRSLLSKYRYRLDTNFAKLDRIQHPELEAFKTRVLSTNIHGYTIMEWSNRRLLTSEKELLTLLNMRG